MADELKTCANCGHAQATGAFCEACGTKLPDVPAAAPAPPPVAAPTPPPAPTGVPAPPPAPAPVTSPPPFAQPAPPPQPPYAPGMPPYPAGYPAYPPAPSPLTDYLAFRKLLTPGLAQIAFWLFEGINLFYWIRMIYYGRHLALEVVFSLVALFITALLIRILMETVITIFKSRP